MNSIMSAGERFTALGSKLSGVLTDFKGSLSVLVSPVVPGVQDLINSLVGSAAPRVSVREASLVSTLDRFHDQPPFIAGERIVSAGGASANACTSGFTGKSATNGKAYMLTAFHCEKPGDARTWAANWPTVIGSASVLDSSHDLAYTPVSQGTVPDTWDGPVQPGLGGEFYKPVISMEHPYVNQQVCASGATSGVRCYANVTGGGWFNYTSNGTNYSAYLWSADSTTGSEMITGGDSGGPVFRPVGNTVVATGVIHGFIDGFTVSCSTVYFYDVTPTDCSNNVTFADVYTEAYINHDINLTLQAP